ncbi:MAG TPA: hypothetical protein VKH62_05225, partial [Candidatus Binatia bacterium]|nr:hypothetical protein [Candidatus Binatia bacterium]
MPCDFPPLIRNFTTKETRRFRLNIFPNFVLFVPSWLHRLYAFSPRRQTIASTSAGLPAFTWAMARFTA